LVHLPRYAIAIACGVLFGGVVAAGPAAWAQPLNHLPPARAPCSVLSGQPCHPSFCDIFHLGPCFPQYLPPIGQDLRLTIISTDDEATENATPGADANAEQTTDDRKLDSIRDMFAALRACWVPPAKDEARHGMEYTIRFAFKRDGAVVAPPRMTYASHDAPASVRDTYRESIDAALQRCTPLHFSEGMAGAVAGRPIAIRYVDERTTDKDSGK
jgi:hypothetical protein